MQLPTIPKIGRLSRKHKITVAGVAAAAAVALTVTGLEATGGGSSVAAGDPTGFSVSTGDQVKGVGAKSGMASQKAINDAAAAKKKAAAQAAAKKKAAAEAAAKAAAQKKAASAAAAKKKAAAEAAERTQEAANRSTRRAPVKHTAPVVKKAVPVAKTAAAPKAAAVTYPDDLDGWIREAQADLSAHGIPVPTYNGIYRNVIRESSGNPNAINLWDSNAAKGIPSKGLLQTIDPTFNTYHVTGTSWNIYDPVANIAAACNYAYHVYGGMDNVNSAY
jgi:hypothetical protein